MNRNVFYMKAIYFLTIVFVCRAEFEIHPYENQKGGNENMIQSIAFTLYPVADMVRSKEFYENVLGLEVSSTFGDQWVEYDLGGNTFAITSMNIGRTPGAKGAAVGFEVSDFEAFTKKLKEKSVKFILDNYETPVCRMSVIEDPDQNHITIHKRHKS